MVWVCWVLQFIHQVLTSKPCVDKLLSLSRLSFTDWWLLMKSVSSFSRLNFFYDMICADLPLLYFQNGKGFCQSFGRSWFVHSKEGSFVNVFVIMLQAWSSSAFFVGPCRAAMFILCSCFAPRFICAAPCKYFWKHLGWSDRRGLLVRSDVGASLFHRRHFRSRGQRPFFLRPSEGSQFWKASFWWLLGITVPRFQGKFWREEGCEKIIDFWSLMEAEFLDLQHEARSTVTWTFIFQVFGDANQTDGLGIPCFWVVKLVWGILGVSERAGGFILQDVWQCPEAPWRWTECKLFA